jgi:hypothetical protein
MTEFFYEDNIESFVSPLAILLPKSLFLDKLPKDVNIKSPIPARPYRVSFFAP